MNNSPLQPLVWMDGGNNYGNLEAHSPSHYYVITEEDEKQKVMYGKHYHISKEATGFATIDEAKQWAWNHYNEKMQPYVKPTPAKVYELTYDCGDSYSTLFMTLDKQQAVDFIESVKKHDDQFICDTSYDEYEVETIHDLYNDNHPLAPYKDKIFDAIYEDSFSEWALSYVGSSFVSSLGIIEHELFSAMQNNKGE